MMQADEALNAVLAQIDLVLTQLSSTDYTRPLREFDGSTLGQHFRHILEFFQCLEAGIAGGTVDYAARARNLLYETNPQLAAEGFAAFSSSVGSWQADMPVAVRAEFGAAERPVYPSTVGRELVFVYDHAIHHLAIIRIGLRCRFPAVRTSPDLGVSQSTLKARASKLQ